MENLLAQKVVGNIRLSYILIILIIILVFATSIKIMFFAPKVDVYITLQLCEKTNLYSLTNCGRVIKTAISEIKTGNLTKSIKITNILETKNEINGEIRKNILLNLKLNADKKTNSLYFQNQKLKENSLLFIEGDKSSLQGVITRISFLPIANHIEEKIITFELYNTRQWIANSISIGDKQIENNETLIEITNKEVKDAEIEATDSYGNVLKQKSPIFKDIKLQLKIYAERENNLLLFKGKEIKIGNTLEIETSKAEFSGIITSII